jgi:hypothetical protein
MILRQGSEGVSARCWGRKVKPLRGRGGVGLRRHRRGKGAMLGSQGKAATGERRSLAATAYEIRF